MTEKNVYWDIKQKRNKTKQCNHFLLFPQLETRLSEKEEQLLEKDLIFEQVTRLAGRVRGKAETGKDDTLDLAKRVSGS